MLTNAIESRLEGEALVTEMLSRVTLPEAAIEGVGPGLRAAIHALDREPYLTARGRSNALTRFSDSLRRLAAIEQDRVFFPEIADVEVAPTLFILGLPRCGTSVLQALLGSDPDVRTPLMWEVAEPSPPPLSNTRLSDPRIARYDDYVAATYVDEWTTVRKAHPIGAMMPQEDQTLLETAFQSFLPNMHFRLPAYFEHYLAADTRFGYGVHRKWLQHLQWGNPRSRWVLKVQEHVYHLPELRSIYPDGVFVHCHRDPVQVMASIAKLIASLRSRHFSVVDPVALGEEMLRLWHEGEARVMGYRRAHPELKIYDMPFKELVGDPIGAVRQLYAFYRYDFTPGAESAMRKWLADNPSDKHGRHVYDLADYGLSEAKVRDAYEDYMTTFRDFI